MRKHGSTANWSIERGGLRLCLRMTVITWTRDANPLRLRAAGPRLGRRRPSCCARSPPASGRVPWSLASRGLAASRCCHSLSVSTGGCRQARQRHTPPPRSRSPPGEDSEGAGKPPMHSIGERRVRTGARCSSWPASVLVRPNGPFPKLCRRIR